MSSIDATLSERGQRYGEFENHAEHSLTIKALLFTLLGEEKAKTLKADQVEALNMIAHKLARITNGDPHYDDSWRDIAGYAQLVANRLAKDAAKAKAKPEPAPEVVVHSFTVEGGDMPPEIHSLLRRFLDPQ